jgi:hypothetical protein
MSQLKSYPATCTQCGNHFQARLWSSINVTLHPQLEALLLSGRLNLATCPRCSTTAPTEPPLLYHDMEAARAILALSPEDRGRAEQAKQAMKADFEEMKRSAGGDESLPPQFAAPQVVFGYAALMQAVWPEAAPAPAPTPAAAPPSEAASVEARRERLRQFTPEDVKRLTHGLNLVCEAVTTAQVTVPALRTHMQEMMAFLTRRCLVADAPPGVSDKIYHWIGNAYFRGWFDARALWQRQYAATGQPPSTGLEWLASLSAAEVQQAVQINEAAADADGAAAQKSQALNDWRMNRLELLARRLAGARKATQRKKLGPLLLAIAQRTYVEGFAEGLLVEDFLAEAGLPPQVTQAAAPAQPLLPPKPIEEMTVKQYLEYEISRRQQAGQGEISAGSAQDLLTASRQKERTIVCGHCGHRFPLRLWSAVNIATHAHLRGILRQGKIHSFRCAGCGNYGEAESVLQYYDPGGPLLLQVYPKRYADNRSVVVSEFEMVLAYIQGLPPAARPKGYPANGTVLFGMADLADFLRRREPESPPVVTGRSDGEGLMALSKETFDAVVANLDSSVDAWRELVASSGPLQRLRQHRVWYVVRGAAERVQSTQPQEAAIEKIGLAVGAVCFLGFGDGRHLHHYEWARRGQPPAEPGPWLAAFTDPEIVHAVHKEELDESGEAWGKALGSASTVQAWQHDFLASQAVREAVRRVSETTSRAESGQVMTQIAEQAYDRSLVLAMLLAAWLRGA